MQAVWLVVGWWCLWLRRPASCFPSTRAPISEAAAGSWSRQCQRWTWLVGMPLSLAEAVPPLPRLQVLVLDAATTGHACRRPRPPSSHRDCGKVNIWCILLGGECCPTETNNTGKKAGGSRPAETGLARAVSGERGNFGLKSIPRPVSELVETHASFRLSGWCPTVRIPSGTTEDRR